jgi:hypothetical protein
MDRMTSYPTLDRKGKTRKSNNIELITISSKTSMLTDDNVVVLAVQVDATGEQTRPDAMSPILRGNRSRHQAAILSDAYLLESARVEQTKMVSGSVE